MLFSAPPWTCNWVAEPLVIVSNCLVSKLLILMNSYSFLTKILTLVFKYEFFGVATSSVGRGIDERDDIVCEK